MTSNTKNSSGYKTIWLAKNMIHLNGFLVESEPFKTAWKVAVTYDQIKQINEEVRSHNERDITFVIEGFDNDFVFKGDSSSHIRFINAIENPHTRDNNCIWERQEN